MKSKLLTILTVIILSCLCLFTLTACENGDNGGITPPTHEHSFTNYVSDNNATLDADGTKTAKCDNCDATDTIIDVGSKLIPTDKSAFIFDNGTIRGLTNYGKTLTTIIIPKTIDGINVTSIGEEAFYNCDSLTSIVIPDSVKSIGNYAFYNCNSLTSVTIGNSVTSIGAWAFWSCDSLTKVNYLGTIDSWAQIEFASSSANPISYAKNLYINDVLVTEAVLTSTTKISDYAFEDCISLTSVTIGNVVTSIGNYAFWYCDSLTSVTIGNGVTSIGNQAFSYCYSLTSVTIGNGVTSIGNYAFYDCYKLVEVINNSPNITVEKGSSNNGYVGYYALSVSNCDSSYVTKVSTDSNGYVIYSDGNDKILVNYVGSQTELTLPNDITEIYKYAFYNNDKITSVSIPDSVTSIGERAFWHCYSLTSIVIPNSVTSIGSNAFYFCSSLTKVNYLGTIDSWAQIEFGSSNANPIYHAKNLYINDVLVTEAILTSATKISSCAFLYCTSLTSIVIPESVTSIGDDAFCYCKSLTSIVIPESVTSIGDYAFAWCGSLKSVTIGNSVTSIGDDAFYDCDKLTSIVIPNSVTSIGKHAFRSCDSLTSIKYRGSSSQWSAISKGLHWNYSTGDYTIIFNYTGD